MAERTRKRKGLSKLDLSKAKKNLKGRSRDRYRRPERYAIYIDDRLENDGRKTPIFGTIEKETLDFLKLKLADLQKMPNSGIYTSVEGLKLDYNFVENVLWKTTTGTANGNTYNNSSPVALLPKSVKIKIQVKSAITKSRFKILTIGVPDDFTFADAANFIVKNKIGVNEKVAKWSFGKNSETLRDLGQTKKKDSESSGSWYIPIGVDLSVKRNSSGVLSSAKSGVKQKTLIIATVKARCAKLLGFTNSLSTDLKALENGTTIDLSFDAPGSGSTGKTYRAFAKIAAYSKVLVKDESDTVAPLDPGTGITVKISFARKALTASKPKEEGVSTKRTVKNSTTYANFLVPSGTPIGVIYNMLSNAKIRPSGFAISSDGKNFGRVYQIPPKSRR